MVLLSCQIALVLIPRKVHIVNTAVWSVFTSLPQPIMAVFAFHFTQQVRWVWVWVCHLLASLPPPPLLLLLLLLLMMIMYTQCLEFACGGL